MSFETTAFLGDLFGVKEPTATTAPPLPDVAPEAVDAADQPRDLGAYVRAHGRYPPGGLAGWEWKPGERPGPPDPPAWGWEQGVPWDEVPMR